MASDKKKRQPPLDDQYSEKEATRRRDEVTRRMVNTPPQPRKAKNLPHLGKKTSTADHKKDRDRGKS